MKRGLAVEFIHFSGEPYLDPTATMKAQAQARVLNGFQAARPGAMWVVPFGNQQRMLSAVSRGVAPDRALPPPDGAHRLRARGAAATRRRS